VNGGRPITFSMKGGAGRKTIRHFNNGARARSQPGSNLEDENRYGLIGQGRSPVAHGAYWATGTRPVVRGAWVLDQTRPATPPAPHATEIVDGTDLRARRLGGAAKTMRADG